MIALIDYKAGNLNSVAKAFEKIVEIAKDFGYSSIKLTVNKNNKKTIDAYLKYRLAIIDKAVTDIGNGFVMDDYIMEYTIQ